MYNTYKFQGDTLIGNTARSAIGMGSLVLAMDRAGKFERDGMSTSRACLVWWRYQPGPGEYYCGTCTRLAEVGQTATI